MFPLICRLSTLCTCFRNSLSRSVSVSSQCKILAQYGGMSCGLTLLSWLSQQNSRRRSDLRPSSRRSAPHQCHGDSLLCRSRSRILVDSHFIPSRSLCPFPSLDSSSLELQTPSTISPFCSSPLPSSSAHSLRRSERLSLPR